MSNIDPYIHTQVWESKKAVRALYCGLCSNSISCSPKLQLMFLMAHVFIFNYFVLSIQMYSIHQGKFKLLYYRQKLSMKASRLFESIFLLF